MGHRRLGLLAACIAVALPALVPLPTGARALPERTERARFVLPTAPDLARCGGWQDEDCGPLLRNYGRRVAARLAVARPTRATFPAWGNSPAVTDPCTPDAFPGAVCGHVDVPFDRSDPSRGTISIAFELYVHSDPGPAESAILVNFGGPGGGTITGRGSAFYLAGPNLATHDLLLIDDRGRGYSNLIDCPGLQYAVGTLEEQVAECAGILGDTVDLYGTGDVAMDTDVVREALGYELMDYYGVSYGGADISAYATRFPQHIRSLVLDAPWGPTQILEEFVDFDLFVESTLDGVRLVCRRSPTCRAEHPDPEADFAALVDAVRSAPVTGRGTSWDGSRIDVTLDPDWILEYMMATYGVTTTHAEIAAASTALSQGDPVPVLRLAAEGWYPLCCQEPPDPPPPPPVDFSLGNYVTTFCADNHWAWNWNSPIDQRVMQHEAALAAASPDLFSPFLGSEAAESTFLTAPYCIRWPNPTGSEPIAPPSPTYPDVPTLVIVGDLDNVVPIQQATWMAGLFPNSEYVEFPGAFHGAAFWSSCALGLVQEFVQTLELGDRSCASRPEFEIPAVGEFPLLAADATPAQPAGGDNEAGPAERRVAAVAVATVRDALARANLGFIGPGEIRSRGLRGGRVDLLYRGKNGFNWAMRLHNARFAEDVTVSGVVHLSPDGSRVWADLTIGGAGTAGGALSVATDDYLGERWFHVTGSLGGRIVDVRVGQV
jgi:pimeloyl-ACP methyl ester carboxylesterase